MLMADMTFPEAKTAIDKAGLVLVPCGSFEAHGHHLPLSTDADTALEIAKRAGEKADIPVAPLIPFGMSQHWSVFPGTITFTSETYAIVIREVCDCLFRAGAKRLLFVNGHGGNNRVLQETLSNVFLQNRGQRTVALVHCLGVLGEIWSRAKEYKFGHSDMREASIMLALKPQSVHLDRAQQVDVFTKQIGEGLTVHPASKLVYQKGSLFYPWALDQWLPAGSWGELRDSSAEMGEEILEVVSDYIAGFAKEFRKTPV